MAYRFTKEANVFRLSIVVTSSFFDGTLSNNHMWYERFELSMNALYALYFFLIACLTLVKSPGYDEMYGFYCSGIF